MAFSRPPSAAGPHLVPPPGVRHESVGDNDSIAIRWRRPVHYGLAALAGLLLIFCWALLRSLRLAPDVTVAAFAGVLLVAAAGMVVACVAGMVNHTTFVMSGETLHIRHGPVVLRRRGACFARSHLHLAYVKCLEPPPREVGSWGDDSDTVRPPPHYALRVRTADGRSVRLGRVVPGSLEPALAYAAWHLNRWIASGAADAGGGEAGAAAAVPRSPVAR